MSETRLFLRKYAHLVLVLSLVALFVVSVVDVGSISTGGAKWRWRSEVVAAGGRGSNHSSGQPRGVLRNPSQKNATMAAPPMTAARPVTVVSTTRLTSATGTTRATTLSAAATTSTPTPTTTTSNSPVAANPLKLVRFEGSTKHESAAVDVQAFMSVCNDTKISPPQELCVEVVEAFKAGRQFVRSFDDKGDYVWSKPLTSHALEETYLSLAERIVADRRKERRQGPSKDEEKGSDEDEDAHLCSLPSPVFGDPLNYSDIYMNTTDHTFRSRKCLKSFRYISEPAEVLAILHHTAAMGGGLGLNNTKVSRGLVFWGDSMIRQLFNVLIGAVRGQREFIDHNHQLHTLYLVYRDRDEVFVFSDSPFRGTKLPAEAERHLRKWYPGYLPYNGDEERLAADFDPRAGDTNSSEPLLALLYLFDPIPNEVHNSTHHMRNLTWMAGSQPLWGVARNDYNTGIIPQPTEFNTSMVPKNTTGLDYDRQLFYHRNMHRMADEVLVANPSMRRIWFTSMYKANAGQHERVRLRRNEVLEWWKKPLPSSSTSCPVDVGSSDRDGRCALLSKRKYVLDVTMWGYANFPHQNMTSVIADLTENLSPEVLTGFHLKPSLGRGEQLFPVSTDSTHYQCRFDSRYPSTVKGIYHNYHKCRDPWNLGHFQWLLAFFLRAGV